MSKGGNSSSTVDPRIMSLIQQNYASAQNVANRPYQPYSGDLTAGLTPSQTQAGGLLQGAPTMGQGALQTGMNAATAGTNYQAPQVAAGAYTPATAPAGLFGGAPAAGSASYSAQGYNPATASAGLAGPASTYTAAQINPNSVASISGPRAGLGGLNAYYSPYVNDVVNTSLADLNHQNQVALNNTNEGATAEGAFGGTRNAVADALTNEAYARIGAGTIANERNQGFNSAAGLMQNNQQMNLSAQQANAANQLAIQEANQAAQNAALSQGATASNNVNLFNAGNTQQTNLANAGAANTAGAFNAGAGNAAGAFNAGNQQQTGLFNAGNAQQTGLFNAGNQQAVDLANAGAENAGAQFNLGNALNAALANQGAANTSQQLNNQASGLLGTLGATQNSNYLSGVNALNAYGTEQQQTEQNYLNALYQQYMNQFNYPAQMQGVLNGSLPMSGAGTSSPTAAMQNAGGLLGSLGSLAQGAGLLSLFL